MLERKMQDHRTYATASSGVMSLKPFCSTGSARPDTSVVRPSMPAAQIGGAIARCCGRKQSFLKSECRINQRLQRNEASRYSPVAWRTAFILRCRLPGSLVVPVVLRSRKLLLSRWPGLIPSAAIVVLRLLVHAAYPAVHANENAKSEPTQSVSFSDQDVPADSISVMSRFSALGKPALCGSQY